jgi:hypothetical protein
MGKLDFRLYLESIKDDAAFLREFFETFDTQTLLVWADFVEEQGDDRKADLLRKFANLSLRLGPREVIDIMGWKNHLPELPLTFHKAEGIEYWSNYRFNQGRWEKNTKVVVGAHPRYEDAAWAWKEIDSNQVPFDVQMMVFAELGDNYRTLKYMPRHVSKN